jgi:hypothetical protein
MALHTSPSKRKLLRPLLGGLPATQLAPAPQQRPAPAAVPGSGLAPGLQQQQQQQELGGSFSFVPSQQPSQQPRQQPPRLVVSPEPGSPTAGSSAPASPLATGLVSWRRGTAKSPRALSSEQETAAASASASAAGGAQRPRRVTALHSHQPQAQQPALRSSSPDAVASGPGRPDSRSSSRAPLHGGGGWAAGLPIDQAGSPFSEQCDVSADRCDSPKSAAKSPGSPKGRVAMVS